MSLLSNHAQLGKCNTLLGGSVNKCSRVFIVVVFDQSRSSGFRLMSRLTILERIKSLERLPNALD